MGNHHDYKEGMRGRGLSHPAPNQRAATLSCSRCNVTGTVALASLLPPDVIDKKFVQQGWAIDPNTCPNCRAERARAKEKPHMASAAMPTAAAVKGTAEMFHLLSEHFFPDAGAYRDGWGDAAIAEKTGIAPDLVIQFREAGFGKLKEPEELSAMRGEVKALHALIDEQREALAAITSVADMLERRVTDAAKRWAA